MKEIYVNIPGFAHYQVSNIGNVRSIPRFVRHSITGKMICRNGRVLIKRLSNCGYLRVSLTENGVTKAYSVHRLVAMSFLENPSLKKTVNHKDGVKTNNFYKNLEWNTHQENVIHGHKNGLNNPAKGMQFVNRAKFSDSDIKAVRRLYHRAGWTQLKIATFFKVSRPTISRILNGKIWRHVI